MSAAARTMSIVTKKKDNNILNNIKGINARHKNGKTRESISPRNNTIEYKNSDFAFFIIFFTRRDKQK